MSNVIHNTLTDRENHHPFSFVYVNSVQRLADTNFTDADLYKWAIQIDDNSTYMLIDYSPPTWQQFSLTSSGGGSAPSGIAGGDLSGTYPNPQVLDNSHAHTPGVTIPAYPTSLPPSGIASGDLAGNYPNPSLKLTGVVAGTYTKITVDDKGRATFGSTLAVSDLPDIPASKIASGIISLSRLPIGTTAGTVAAGDDPRFTPSGIVPPHTHVKANIVDFPHVHTIGDLPVAPDGVSSSIQIVRADDSRLSNSRTPVAHNHVKADITDFAHNHLIGDLPVAVPNEVSSSKLVRADDPRLSNTRTPTPGTINFVDIAGTIQVSQLISIPASNLPIMTGATLSTAGTAGIVPAPSAGDPNRVFTAGGNYISIPGGGDMLKSVYDTNNNGVVDLAEVATLANAVAWLNITGRPTSYPTNVSSITIDGNLNMNGYRISNMAVPINNDEAATKFYVDNLLQTVDYKVSVRAATTANIVLTGPQTIDGVSLLAGDRVLVKDQTVGANNGIYIVDNSTWQRASDYNTLTKVSSGGLMYVEEGTNNGKQIFVLTNTGNVILGTTALSFESTNQSVYASSPLTKVGGTISLLDSGVTPGTYTKVVVTSKGLVSAGSTLTASDIPNIDTLNGVLPLSKGGTGATNVTDIRAGLRSFRTITNSATISINDDVVLVDSGASNITLTLPLSSSKTGFSPTIKKISSDTNTITVVTQGSETIDGSPNEIISSQWTTIKLISNGTNYFLI